ncbi:hypothetical protein GALMADRAFT_273209 [Galerina marginata CBS 339.88]|uniref:Uncharacterized protein n=1 Tax=Galerina marginata (strain CBS 339.88) TaxID=685588 RepID=A0A067S962_GALM3|nr:hypothetical protein GALMADRAFT_273209 [Galerina marginata CBS 339.88]
MQMAFAVVPNLSTFFSRGPRADCGSFEAQWTQRTYIPSECHIRASKSLPSHCLHPQLRYHLLGRTILCDEITRLPSTSTRYSFRQSYWCPEISRRLRRGRGTWLR